MILAVFGTVYLICLSILALTFLKAKPLAPGARDVAEDADDGSPRERRRAQRERPGGVLTTLH